LLTIQQLLDHIDQRPNQIMIVGGSAEQLRESLHRGEGLAQWNLICTNDIDRFIRGSDSTKLVVITNTASPDELLERARRFAGPTLNLTDVRPDQMVAELIAAAEAMG